jgi:hypothetical protein
VACCCKGSATWFCCYPDNCGCDNCCCNGTHPTQGCSSEPHCGQGSCLTCNSGNFGFAWRSDTYCGCNFSCGTYAEFSHDCNHTLNFVSAPRVDTGPCSTCTSMVDFTKALFMVFAPLSQGLITFMQATANNDLNCC